MKLLELFSGTHSVGVVAKKLNIEITSLDRDLGAESKLYDYESENHIMTDIMTWDYKKHFKQGDFDIITASPVCLWWSAMRRAKMTKERIDKDIDLYGKPMVDKVFEIIEYFKPKYYWIENPYTGLMKHYIKSAYPQYYDKNVIVDYCKYDDEIGYQKRTIFWTNISINALKCKKDCKNFENGRHKVNIAYNTYVIDNGKQVFIFTKQLREKYRDYEKHHQKTTKNKYDRYKIPIALVNELLTNCCADK